MAYVEKNYPDLLEPGLRRKKKMPFKSEAQRRYLWKNNPEVAEKWAHEKGGKKKDLPYHVKRAKKALQKRDRL